jgi:hypothetical protein
MPQPATRPKDPPATSTWARWPSNFGSATYRGSSSRDGFLGLLTLYALRQICQGLCALPPPERMIWRYPGFPSLLVTYGTATDLFFSGHTAIAVYGAIELGHVGGPWGGSSVRWSPSLRRPRC